MAEHEAKIPEHDHPEDPQAHATRRAVLQAAIGVSAGAAVLSTLWVGAGLIPRVYVLPTMEPVAVGDTLVFASGPRVDQPISVDDLRVRRAEPIPFFIAFPKSPQNVVKKDLATNIIMVILTDPARMSPETRQHASAEGVLAYSAVCKHLGCTVSLWRNDTWTCPCHFGKYDIYNQARVIGGPVPAPVPQLPVRVEEGRVVVAGEFLAEPGA
jgi:rieske iron-sulfur protein